METKRYVIVDDSNEDAQSLKRQLDDFPFLVFGQFADSVEQALTVLTTQPVDLLFLDLDLKGKNGLDVLQALDDLPAIIITSAHAKYAAQSYEIGKAADYLVKPFTYERLLKSLSRALSIQVAKSSVLGTDFIFLKMGRQIQRFDLQDIDYIEAYGIYSKVYSNEQPYTVNERLTTLSELLSDRLFQRVHKSFIVNVGKITRFDRNTLWLKSTPVPIGNFYRPKIDGLFKLLMLAEEGD